MLNREHRMTGEDRNVLANLLEKIKAIHSVREHDKYVYFLKKAMEEAERRNAAHFYERFKSMLMAVLLSKRAKDTRLSSRGITKAVACAMLSIELA